jgi:molybdate transport system substrate-binding protein
MKTLSRCLTISLLCSLPYLGVAISLMGHAQAAELQVIAGSGIAAPLNEIVFRFEKATGHKIVVRYGTAPQLIKMAATTPFDLGVCPEEVYKDAAARGQFPPELIPNIARIGVGVAVKVGAPKPDIGTPEALKQTLLKAKSIASIPASATGVLLAGVYERLGIAEEMKARIKAQPTPGQIPEAVANGDAELAVFILNVLTDPRLDVVGPLPDELKREVVYTAGIAVSAREPEAAKAFIAYVMSPDSAAAIRAKGMTPGAGP